MVEKVQIFGHVKSGTYYGKKFYFVLDQDRERVIVEKCGECFEIGEVITEDTKHKDEMEWQWEECDKCNGHGYYPKEKSNG